MPKPVPYTGTLLERRDLSPTLAVFRVRPDRVPPAPAPWFEPGQYTVLGVNVEEGGASRGLLRSFSVASEPEERRWLEFYIRYAVQPASEEPLTPHLWRLRAGQRLHVGRRCTGRFTFRHTVGEADPRWKILVAGGTGLAPFLSMVRSLARRGRDALARLVVLHGASHPEELGYRRELEVLLNRGRQGYFPTVSRPHEHPEWLGSTGRVETFFEPPKLAELEAALDLGPGGLTPERAVLFVCGHRGTVAETLRRVMPLGFVPSERRVRHLLRVPDEVPSSAFVEQFDPAPIFEAEELERLRRVVAQRR